MRIEYTLTFRDWLLFNLTHQFLSPIVQVFVAGPAAIFYFTTVSDGGTRAVGVAAAILAYLFIWLIQIVFTVIYGASGRNRALLTKHVIELQDEALYNETAYGRSYHYWSGINKVVLRPGFTAVYINALAAHIIPRRAFAGKEQVWQFVATIQERLRAARG